MRNRKYHRYVREKSIDKKYHIREFLWGHVNTEKYYEEHPKGSLNKGKIHCSCWMCRKKSSDELTKKEKISLEKMEFYIKDLQ